VFKNANGGEHAGLAEDFEKHGVEVIERVSASARE
jgi:hypothetical protein